MQKKSYDECLSTIDTIWFICINAERVTIASPAHTIEIVFMVLFAISILIIIRMTDNHMVENKTSFKTSLGCESHEPIDSRNCCFFRVERISISIYLIMANKADACIDEIVHNDSIKNNIRSNDYTTVECKLNRMYFA